MIALNLVRRLGAFFRSLFFRPSQQGEIENGTLRVDRSLQAESLEPRILYSAAPAPTETPPVEEAPPVEAEPVEESPAAAAEAAAAEADAALFEPDVSEAEAAPEVEGDSEISPDQGVELLDVDALSAPLNQDTLEALAEVAAERWRETGLTDEQISTLDSITYTISDLGGNNLGSAEGSSIVIDDNAGGNLWFVDATPLQDEEFVSAGGSDSSLRADDDSAAAARYDLLTAIMHEQGHVLGVAHAAGNSGALMDELLSLGNRRLPSEGQADGAEGWIYVANDDGETSLQAFALVGSGTTESTGQGQAFDIRQPYATVNYAIALIGTFPSENLSTEDPDPLALSTGTDPILGSIMQFGGNFAPRGWALADGQLLSIAQNQALFSILGTTYGGDGETTFALPDLRGRVPVGVGSGPGLSPVTLGQRIGAENEVLTGADLPQHSHGLNGGGTTGDFGSATPAAVNNRMPGLGLTPVIATEGTFPFEDLSTDIGSVYWFAGNFAPEGYALANGALLNIASNTALFSILGTTYGGDGETTFGLPDLRGRTPIHAGNGPGLNSVTLGQKGGSETFTLAAISNLPSHDHEIDDGNVARLATTSTGAGTGIESRQPFLGLYYEIALQGVFPSSNLSGEEETTESENPGVLEFSAGNELIGLEAADELIQQLAAEGISRWAEAGISAEQVAQLQSATYTIADLDSGYLASVVGPGLVKIDADASNAGWFIDSTPGDDQEFLSTDPLTGELLATDSAALHRYDLLTTIMHEQGHLLGLSHATVRGSVMSGTLGVGGRLEPVATDIVEASSQVSTTQPLSAGADFTAQIGMFAGNFAVRGYSLTDGQLVAIASNQALFSLLGTTYGGDGETTFALPDLRGRAVVHAGNGPGLSSYSLGDTGGARLLTPSVAQMAAHSHGIPEISVEHKPTNDEISDGETATSGITLEGTDFGPVDTATGMVTRTFVVRNTGNADLIVQPVTINGTGNTHFSVTTNFAADQVIAMGGSADFVVEFDPTADGVHNAEISFANNDGDGNENPYNFAIAGQGTTAGPPATEETGISISGTDLVITDVLGGNTDDDLTISISGTTLTIVDNNGNGIDLGTVTGTGDGTSTVTIDTGVFAGGIIFETLAGDDNLTVDFSTGNFGRTIDFNGGDQSFGGDQMFLDGGGTFADTTYNFTNENEGTIDITGNSLITYTGLEPITSTITATNVTLNYSSASEAITVTAAGASTRVDSTAGEVVTFTNPTTLLTINAGDGDDTINVNGFGTGFAAALAISGQAGSSDLIKYGADGVSLGAGNGATFTAERVDFAFGDLTTTDGNIIVTGTGGSGGSFKGVRILGTTLTTGSGNIDIDGEGGDTGNLNQGVEIISSSSLTTGGGNIDIDGTGGGTGVSGHGVSILVNSSLSVAGSGTINIDGTSSTTGTLINHGVSLSVGSSATVDNGNLTIVGTGSGSSGSNNGIDAVGTTLTSGLTGSISLTGSSSGSGSSNRGISFVNSTISNHANGSGLITLNGTGSSSGLSYNEGIRLINTDLTTGATGGIDIDGLGGGSGTGSLNNGVAIMVGSTITAGGISVVTIDGTGGNGSLSNRGVFSTGTNSISSLNGNITVQGTGNGSVSFNRGIDFATTTVKSTGIGQVTIIGTGSTTSSGLFNSGVSMITSTLSTGSGNLTITGVGGTGSHYNEGVRLQSSAATSIGVTNISGTANAATTGLGNAGVYIFLNSTVNGNLSSSITGTGGGGTGFNHGVLMNIGITSNIVTITGTAGLGPASADRFGNFAFPP